MGLDNKDQKRLNKHLALCLGISRRQADDLIAESKVFINDEPATLGARITDSDEVKVNGKKLSGNVELVYLALNKPAGYVCSRQAQGESKTIYELLPKKYQPLKSVGRLDKDSSGIILLTNDGDFAFQMTHPSFHKVKTYTVKLDKDLEPLHQQMISNHGVNLDDGVSQLVLERAGESDRKEWIITMHEGRNRQIRRTFDSLGYTVKNLHRTNFGNYALGDIKPGKYSIVKP
jgi:23S rRNA pseudouridine2605 synthase